MSGALSRMAGLALVLGGTASIAWAGAGITWRLLGLEAGSPLAPVSLIDAAPPAPPDLTPVFALAPFGERVAAFAPVPVAAAPAAPMTDGLVLRGVTMAEPVSRSRALIIVDGARAVSFGLGQVVARGAVLSAVRGNGVTLERDGETATLGFARPGNVATAATAGVDRLSAMVTGQAVPSNTAPTPERIIDTYRKRIAVNPMAVLNGFDVAPVENGYRIGANPPPDVARAGLRPGDIIASVNGERVGDIEADRRLFEKVVASGQARVEILRGTRRVILSFPLR